MAEYPIKMLKDEQEQPFVPLVSTDGIQSPEGQTLDQILQAKLGPANLHGGDNVTVRTENYDCYIDVTVPASSNVINNLTTNQAGEGALDAYQGKILNEKIPGLINDLNSTDANKALAASQGKILNDKIPEVVDDVITEDSTKALSAKQGKELNEKIPEIVDNVTTSDSTKALSAKQGKELNDKIPEVIDNLTTADSAKALSANQGKVLNEQLTNIQDLIKEAVLATKPIGSIEINTSGDNPSTYLGGTWEAWGSGRVPIGIDTSDSDFSTVEKTGGNKRHDHSISHTHNVPGSSHSHQTYNHTLAEDEIPSHKHQFKGVPYYGGGASVAWGNITEVLPYYYPENNITTYTRGSAILENGGDSSHNHGSTSSTTPSSVTTNSQSSSYSGYSSNVQPYITCYMWKRTA